MTARICTRLLKHGLDAGGLASSDAGVAAHGSRADVEGSVEAAHGTQRRRRPVVGLEHVVHQVHGQPSHVQCSRVHTPRERHAEARACGRKPVLPISKVNVAVGVLVKLFFFRTVNCLESLHKAMRKCTLPVCSLL